MKKNEEYRDLLRNIAREWKWIFFYVRKYKFALFLYTLLGLFAIVMSLGVSVAGKHLIDAVIAKSNDTIFMFGVIAISLAVFQHGFQALSSYVTAFVSSKISNEIREDIYAHIVSAQWEEISRFHSGDVINRLETDVQTVSGAVINFIPSVITRGAQFLGALGIVLYYDSKMAPSFHRLVP